MMNIDNKLQSMADGGEAPKRSAEDGGGQNYKRARGGSGSSGDSVELRFLIPSCRAGAVIGKCGETIKRLRTDFLANVGVPDCSGPERILTIKAEMENALNCLAQCIPLLVDKEDMGVRLIVHQSHAGAIIGRAGFKIKDLRAKTGATIKMYTEMCPNSSDRVVSVSGTPEVITDAVRSILELIQDVPIKGTCQKYDPFCAEEFMCHAYGGFTSEQRWEGGRGGRRPVVGGGLGGRGGAYRRGGALGGAGAGRMDNFSALSRDFAAGGSAGGGGGGGSGFYRDDGFNRGGFGSNRGRGGDRGGRMDRGGGGNRRNFSDDSFGGGAGGGFSQQVESSNSQGNFPCQLDSGEIQTNQVTIPKELAGSIIGTCGNRIREIRQGCKAKIKIEDPVEGSSERIITITGTHTQIENAQWLLQSSVKKYSGQFF